MTKEKIKQLAIKTELKTLNKLLEVKRMDKFNHEKLNIARLKPNATDVELNKCTHMFIDEETSTCTVCGKHITCDIAFDEETSKAIDLVIDKLESLKMVMNELSSKKELKIAQPYFDMIPLLKNLESLQNVVVDDYTNYINTLNQIAANKNTESEQSEERDEETFLKALTLEDENDEEEETKSDE